MIQGSVEIARVYSEEAHLKDPSARPSLTRCGPGRAYYLDVQVASDLGDSVYQPAPRATRGLCRSLTHTEVEPALMRCPVAAPSEGLVLAPVPLGDQSDAIRHAYRY